MYRKTISLQKYKYFSNLVHQLNNMCDNDPQVYWDTVNKVLDKKEKSSNSVISPESWFKHFTELFKRKT